MSTSIVNFDQTITMTSLDFLNSVVNPAREEAGENPISNKDFMNRVADELNLKEENFLLLDSGSVGRKAKYVNLNADQLLLVGMRESKAVRRKVLEYIRKVEAANRALEDTVKKANSLQVSRAGLTLDAYCIAVGLPPRKLTEALRKSMAFLRINANHTCTVRPKYAEYITVITPRNKKFTESGINFRFNKAGAEFFSRPHEVQRLRAFIVRTVGTDDDKINYLKDNPDDSGIPA